MYDINHNLINGCPLCELFLQSSQRVTFMDKTPMKECEFVILNNNLVVVRDHIDIISNSLWGSILYKCRELYGNDIRLKSKPKIVQDHWHSYISR
jgi:hypothetical protein